MMRECMQNSPGHTLLVVELPASVPPSANIRVAFSLGSPLLPTQNTFEIGREVIFPVVNPANRIAELSADQLRSIYEGNVQAWSDLDASSTIGKVLAYHLSADAALSAAFSGITSQPSDQAETVPDLDTMRSLVSGNPAAIGYLPRSWLNGSVRAVPLAGIHGQENTLPILAELAEPPDAPLSAWLGCLQEKTKEAQAIPQ